MERKEGERDHTNILFYTAQVLQVPVLLFQCGPS